MRQICMIGRRAGAAIATLCMAMSIAAAHAQVSAPGDKQMSDTSEQTPPILSKVTIAQKLDQPIPLNGEFKDETGKTVHMGDYFGKRPAILALVYYQCTMLCSEELKGLIGALEMVKFTPGEDFDVVVVSIDPTDTPAIAATQKRQYLKRYGRPETAAGWHFLTGQEPAIKALAESTGYGYVRVPGPDGKLTQFAHASAIEIITPEGRIAQYYMGVEYSPKDLRLGLVEASQNKIGTPVDMILTYCYHYDPTLNKHSLVVARIVQAGGILTVLSLGSFMIVMFRRDAKRDGNQDETGGNSRRMNG